MPEAARRLTWMVDVCMQRVDMMDHTARRPIQTVVRPDGRKTSPTDGDANGDPSNGFDIEFAACIRRPAPFLPQREGLIDPIPEEGGSS